MGRSEPPNVLESWMRILEAGIEMWNVWRRVASVKIADPPFCPGVSWLLGTERREEYKWRRREIALLHKLRHRCPGISPVVIRRLPLFDHSR